MITDGIEYLQDRLDFEEVLEALGIEISHWLGTWIMCHCPFTENHSNGDENASFGFNTETMGYNCFVCGGGGLLSLVKELLNCNTIAAAEWLQGLSSLEPKDSKDLVTQVTKIMNPITVTKNLPYYLDEVYEMYEKNKGARDEYLKSRNISIDIADETRIGFDTANYGVTIPHWFGGRLRGWQTRNLKSLPKYKNTPNFPKKETLYLYDFAVGHTALVVESPMSALYLWTMGIPNTMATFGSFSIPQAELLKKFQQVRIWPDNDPAGMNNLVKAIGNLAESVDVKILPVVDKPHGDAADVAPEQIHEYLFSAFPASILPVFQGGLPTLEQVKPYI